MRTKGEEKNIMSLLTSTGAPNVIDKLIKQDKSKFPGIKKISAVSALLNKTHG